MTLGKEKGWKRFAQGLDMNNESDIGYLSIPSTIALVRMSSELVRHSSSC